VTTLKRQIAPIFRAIVVVAALAAVLALSTASLLPAHLHNGSAAARCEVCFTAHATACEEPSFQPVPVPQVQGRTTLLLPVSDYQPLSRKSSRSRGPPSFAL